MKHLILSLLVVGMLAAVASADYIDPPLWGDNPSFTHQGWDFSVDPGPTPVDIPANDVNNPNGTAVTTQQAGTWIDVVMTDLEDNPVRQGGILFQGTGDYVRVVDVVIPNDPQPLPMFKEIWLQGILVVVDPTDPNLDVILTVTDDQGRQYVETDGNFPGTVIGAGPVPGIVIGYVVNMWGIWSGRDPGDWDPWYPQPPWESISIDIRMSEGRVIIADQFDIDTRCIPEPSTIAMLLGLTAMGLVAFMRRRK